MPDKPVGRRRPAQRGEGERLRAEIIAAASQMLAATGQVGELSLRAVAREVGVATTSIYLHFHRLDELILAVRIHYFEEFGAALARAVPTEEQRPGERIRARAKAYLRYGTEHPGQYWVMFSVEPSPVVPTLSSPAMSSPTLSSPAPSVHAAAVEVFEALRSEIANAVGPDQDSGLVAVHLWTSLHGIVTLRAARPDFPWPDSTQEIDDLVAKLLAVRSKPLRTDCY